MESSTNPTALTIWYLSVDQERCIDQGIPDVLFILVLPMYKPKIQSLLPNFCIILGRTKQKACHLKDN